MEQTTKIPQPTHEDYQIVMSNALMELEGIVLSNLIKGTEDETLFIGDVLIGALNILSGNSNNYIEEDED